jgi:hypothetical protein
MPHSTDLTERVRTIGLVSSFVAVAAIGLTLVTDNGRSVFGEWMTRSERLFLLVLAVGVCSVHIVLRLVRRRPRARTRQKGQA